jgi:hypothetical protein
VLAADYDDDGDADVYMTGALRDGTSFVDFDLDGDRRTDYPADPKCASRDDPHEDIVLPACGLLGLEGVAPMALFSLVRTRRRRRPQ